MSLWITAMLGQQVVQSGAMGFLRKLEEEEKRLAHLQRQ